MSPTTSSVVAVSSATRRSRHREQSCAAARWIESITTNIHAKNGTSGMDACLLFVVCLFVLALDTGFWDVRVYGHTNTTALLQSDC